MDTERGKAVPRSAVAVTVTLRHHTLVQDKPHASGGKDEGPMASELLLAGLLGCQNSTFTKVAAKRKVTASVQDIQGEMDFKDGDISALRIHFNLQASPDVPDSALETLVRLTDKSCTISRALKVPIESRFSRH